MGLPEAGWIFRKNGGFIPVVTTEKLPLPSVVPVAVAPRLSLSVTVALGIARPTAAVPLTFVGTAFTVSVAALLVTFPATFVTVTVNVAPLSAATVAGVV